MIFDEIGDIMNRDTARRVGRRSGLSKDKVWRMANGCPFVLDYNTIFALNKLGYTISIEKLSHKKDT